MMHRSATDGVAAGRQAGSDFALELAALLHEKVRVSPTSYHGGLLIGRDCHTTGDRSALVCAALVGKSRQSHVAAYAEAWRIWNRVRYYPRGRGLGVSRGYGSHGNPVEG